MTITLPPAAQNTADIAQLLQPGSAATVPQGSSFGEAMLQRIKAMVSSSDKAEQGKKAAQEFVSTALVLPLLKQLRESPFKSEYFHGGQGEDAFGPQLDQMLSDRIVERMSTPEQISSSGKAVQGMSLVDAIYRRIVQQDETAGKRSNHSIRKVDLHG